MSFTNLTENLNIISSLPDKPTLQSNELKNEFDKAGNLIKEFINDTLLIEVTEEILKNKTTVENSLSSDSTSRALSSAQGKALKTLIDELEGVAQKKITFGTSTPSGGSNGDIYVQYFD